MKNKIFNFDDQNNPNESNGENIVNLRKRKVSRLYKPDGSFFEVIQSDTISMPDGKGGWIDTELLADYVDDIGNPLPKSMEGVAISCTGRLIPPGPGHLAVCSSAFHPQATSRNIYIDIDGSIVDGVPVCSLCQQRKQILNIFLILVGMGCVLGIFQAFGWF